MAERVWSLSDPEDPFYTQFVGSHLDQERRVGLANKHPLLRDHARRVQEVPQIKQWLRERPPNNREHF